MTKACKFIKDTLLQVKLQVDPHLVIFGEFNTPLLTIMRPFRQKLNREMVELSNIIIQMDRYLQNSMTFFVDFFLGRLCGGIFVSYWTFA